MPKIEKDLLKVKGSDGQWHYVPAVGGSADTTPTWDALQNKPFSTLGSGLAVDENGVLSAEGGGSANAVQYVAQSLTDEQKKQARTNIGASPIPTVRYWLKLTSDNIINLYNMGVGYGIISPVDTDQTVPTGMSSPMLVIFGRMNYGRVDITVYDGAGAVWRGSLNLSSQTTDVTKTSDYVTNSALTNILQGYVTAEELEDILPQFGQAIGTKLDKNQGAGNAGKILGIGADGIVVPQDKPTYTLPQATADALGGIKADAATAEDTQPVRIGTDGKLRTKPTGGSSITVDDALSPTSENPVQNKIITEALAGKITAPTTAAVGQIIKVKSVDDAGKPTEWEAVDMPSSGSVTDEQVNTAVSAWLTEHPEATTTVADKSITREKMAFPAYEGKLSPNLADPSAYTIARFNSTSGGKQTFGENNFYAGFWRMTDYIYISDHIGEQLWATNWQGYCFYDANKTAISESGRFINTTSDKVSSYSTEPITIPDGAAYIVLAFLYAKGTVDLMLNLGDALLPYVQYGDINLPDASVGDAQINGKLSLDKVDTADLLFPTIGKNLVDKSQMVKNKAVANTGAIVEINASLNYYFVGDIKVTGGADYLVYAMNVVFFDAYGNMCGSDGVNGTIAYRKIKAPISAVSCAVNGKLYDDVPSNMIHSVFMVEGSVLPEKVVCEKIYGEKTIEPDIIGKSVLHRMADCWNPSTKTVIGLCGDSNTRGIMGNGDTTQNPNCWANLVSAEIVKKCSGERRIYPYGDIGVWGCTAYNHREPQTRNAGVIKIPFYGTAIGLVWGSQAGTVDFNVTIDEGETTSTTVPDTGYTWDGLTEGYHTITLEWAAAGTYTISHFVVNKTIEVINRGISGRNFAGINADLGVTGDTVDIICYGTNNRVNGDINGNSTRELDYFEYRNRDTELIYMSPIPALDSIEEANEPWKTIPYIESFIAGREARHNREYISLYHEIKDYCAMNNVELTSLYVDGLHLNDEGHKVVAKILCRKLGLGDLSE